MLVLIKVGDYLTYRYTNNLETLRKDFDEYTPEHEIIVTRDDSYYYFEVIPKLIPVEMKYRPGWFYDTPEIRDLFQNYTKPEGSYFRSEFMAKVKNDLYKLLEKLYSNDGSWGAQRMKELVENDIRTLDFSACPELVNAGDSIHIKCRQFPRGSVFKVGDCEVVFENMKAFGRDPEIVILEDCVAIQSEIGTRPNIEHLAKSLRDKFTNIIGEKEKSNPYLSINEENRIDFNLERTKSFGEAQRKFLRAFGFGE